jgi:hypothetical protein
MRLSGLESAQLFGFRHTLLRGRVSYLAETQSRICTNTGMSRILQPGGWTDCPGTTSKSSACPTSASLKEGTNAMEAKKWGT